MNSVAFTQNLLQARIDTIFWNTLVAQVETAELIQRLVGRHPWLSFE